MSFKMTSTAKSVIFLAVVYTITMVGISFIKLDRTPQNNEQYLAEEALHATIHEAGTRCQRNNCPANE